MERLRLDLKNIHGHLKELDGLRGLAIALVLLFHLFPFIPLSKIGWMGVDLFFVLSGFLITGILQDTVNEKQYWKHFIIRRVLRIFPLYYFVLIAFVLASLLSSEFASLPVVQYSYFSENQVWYWLYLSNIKTFIEGHWLPTIVFNPFWSLSIEEQFYMFWPFVIYTLRGKRLFFTVVSSIVAIVIIRSVMLQQDYSSLSIYVFTFSRLDAILFGSMVAIMLKRENLRILLEKYAVLILLVSASLLTVLGITRHTFSPYMYELQLYGYTVIAFLFSSLLLMVINKDKNFGFLKVIFRNKILVFLGKYSYSLYVFHWIVYRLLREPLKEYFSDHVENVLAKDLLTSFVVLSLTIICSQLTWNLFEKRFIELKSVLAPRG